MTNLYEENKLLRKYLWLNHGCKSHCLYGDDGEMQCSCCRIDFKRDDVKDIVQSIENRNMEELKKMIMDQQTKKE